MTLSHQPCPCGQSSDAFTINENGSGKCFSCSKFYSANQLNQGASVINSDPAPFEINTKSKPFDPITQVFHSFRERGLSKDTIKRYKIAVNQDPSSKVLSKSPLFSDGRHIANKTRFKDKEFVVEGDVKGSKLDLFGQHAFPAGSAKAITITEGYEDAGAAYEMMGSKYPVVSVHGASSALDDCKNNFEYLDSFESIVVCFDKDEPKINPLTGEKTYPGQAAAYKVAQVFAPGKVKILTLREYKDANEYLLNGKASLFTKEWWQAPAYKPDGLKIGNEMWDEIINRPNHFTVPYPFEGLNKFTYGIRLSEMVTLTAETKVGKTSILKELEHSLLMNPELIEKGYGIGFLHLEEPNYDTALGLMSIHNSKPYHLPDTERNIDELRSAYDAVINNNRVVIWDHFGSNTVDAVLDKVRHMHALGCKYIVLDHLSIVVSDQSGDERKQLDEITTKLKTLCMQLNIALICVIHQNRQGQIRGTAGVEQLSNIVIKLERNKLDPDPWRRNVTKMIVEANRFCGKSGPACYVWYNEMTGRLVELTQEEITEFESGGGLRDDQIRF